MPCSHLFGGDMEEDKYAYLCNGEAECNKRADGKVNMFCRGEVDGIRGCFHTFNPEFKKNENPTKFKEVRPHFFVEVE